MIDSLRNMWRQAVALVGEKRVMDTVAVQLESIIQHAESRDEDKLPLAERIELIIANLNLHRRNAGLIDETRPGFRPETGKTKTLLRGLLERDKFTVAQVMLVNEWYVRTHKGKDYEYTIRPSTIYTGEWFESYLQQAYADQAARERKAEELRRQRQTGSTSEPTPEPTGETYFERQLREMQEQGVRPAADVQKEFQEKLRRTAALTKMNKGKEG